MTENEAAIVGSTLSPTSFVPDPYDFEESFVPRIVITKVVSVLSGIGSAYIIYNMIRERKLKRTFERLLLCLCIANLISSISFFLGSWAVPKDPPVGFEDVYGGPGYWNEVHPTAVGNRGTCTLQGYGMYIGTIASVLFTSSIAVSLLLQIKFGFREEDMWLAEYCFYGISTAFPFLTATIILADRGFNPVRSGFCFINTDPFICKKSSMQNWFLEEEDIWYYCMNDVDVRGTLTELYYQVFCAGPVVVALVTIIGCMATMIWPARTQERRVAKWSGGTASNQKRAFVKSMLYIGAFVIVWVPNILVIFIDFPRHVRYYIGPIFLPLQGVLNVLIYSNFCRVFKDRTSVVRDPIRSSFAGPKVGSSQLLSASDAGLKSSLSNADSEKSASETEEPTASSASIETGMEDEPVAVATEP